MEISPHRAAKAYIIFQQLEFKGKAHRKIPPKSLLHCITTLSLAIRRTLILREGGHDAPKDPADAVRTFIGPSERWRHP